MISIMKVISGWTLISYYRQVPTSYNNIMIIPFSRLNIYMMKKEMLVMVDKGVPYSADSDITLLTCDSSYVSHTPH